MFSRLKTILLLSVLVVVSGCSRVDLAFSKLKQDRPDDEQMLAALAGLKDQPRGVELALADFDCMGGETRRRSSWILRYSSLDQTVDDALRKIALDPTTPKPKQLEAFALLWQRTGDKRWLLLLFKGVQKGGSAYIGMARSTLMRLVSEIDGVASFFDVPDSRDLAISEEEFMNLISTLPYERPRLLGN